LGHRELRCAQVLTAAAGDLLWKSSGGDVGPGHLIYHTPAIGHYTGSNVRIHTGNGNESYRAVTSARATVSGGGWKTLVQASLYRRTITHDEPDNNCEYADGVDNPNDPSVASGYVLLADSGVQAVGTSWVTIASSFQNPPTADGYEMDMRVYAHAINQSTGETGWTDLDNIRGEGT
jgi:hypothetical protein